MNQTISNALTKMINEEQDDWDEHLDNIAFSIRTSVQKSTNETPFRMVYGRTAVLPIQSQLPTTDGCRQETIKNRLETIDSLKNIHSQAKKSIDIAQKKQKFYYDRKHQGVTYQAGDQVLLPNPKRINRKGDKMTNRFRGPYTIEESLGNGVYCLRGLKTRFNAKGMKRYTQTQGSKQKELP